VRLDERHRGGDAAEELHVRFGRSFRSRLGRGRYRDGRNRGSCGSVPSRSELERPADDRVLGDEAVPVLEQPPPLRGNRVRRLEILVEEIPDIAEIHSVDAFRWHLILLPVHLSEIGSRRRICRPIATVP
jgi:hypothetical protein